jgi:hypothetical protein
MYPDIPSSIAPVPHCPEFPIPTPPEREQSSSKDSSESDSEESIVDPDDNFRGRAEERNPYYPNQKDLNDLIRDLGLTKSNAELLTSRLKQWNLLDESVQVTDQRKRHQAFSSFFTCQNGLCFCHNVTSLFKQLESPVARMSGTSLLTAHPGASKPCSYIMGTSIRLFLWLTRCT